MANFNTAICKNLFDNVLPSFGKPRVNIPVWDNSQKMFICGEYESAAGHRYYRGVRFCDRVVIVEKVGLYHNWTYIDCIELYAFNGTKAVLIQKRDYDKVFRKEDFIRAESESMVKEYLMGVLKTQNVTIPDEKLDVEVKGIIERCYKSFLDSDFNTRLTNILPAIGE